MLIGALLAMMLGLSAAPLAAPDDAPAGCERATAHAASTKLVRFGGKTFVTYLDVDYRVQVMALDQAAGRWDGPVTVGQAVDSHGGAALAVTRDGTLHMAYGPHGTPMQYTHSLAPGDIRRWTPPEQIGVRTTYPSLAAAPDGTLYLVYRGHADAAQKGGQEWQLTFHSRPPGGQWGPGTVLANLPSDTAQPRANYHQLSLDVLGRLHLTWVSTLVAPGRVYYLCSEDGGRTWLREPGGLVVKLPVGPQGPAPVYAGDEANLMLALALDPDGAPHLLYGPEYGTSAVEHTAPGERSGWQSTGGFRLPGKTIWLHQAAYDRQGKLHVTFTAEERGRWLSNTATVHEAVWAPGGVWEHRIIADLTEYDRGCHMPAIAENDGKLEGLFFSGRDLNQATGAAAGPGHVPTDVYYANLTDNWMQRLAPRRGPRVNLRDVWETLEQDGPPPKPAAEPLWVPPPMGGG